jgi:outer membrane protein OmpA-like peptidoglycan-associated protein
MNRSTPWIAKIPSAAAALTVAWVQIAQAQPTGAPGSAASSAVGPTESSAPTPSPTPTSPGDDEDLRPPAVAAAQGGPDRSEWVERDRAANESNTVTGGVGLLRTQHAESGAPGQFRIGLAVEWFSAGFLCTSAFPCPNPHPQNGGPQQLTSDTLSHFGGTLSLGATIANIGPGTLEGYASTTSYANSDTANEPELLQVLGDTNLGVKYVAPLGDVMRMGGFTELWLINGSGAVGLDGGGTGAKFGALATADLRGLSSPVPLRFSLNVVYSLDNTGSVLSATEAALRQPVSRIERYGLGVNRVDHVDVLLGGEGLLVDERVRPFVEAHVLIADNRQRYRCVQTNPSHDNCLKFDGDGESTLTIGGRFMPWKRGFSILAALDIGLTGTANFVEELQPVPPWTLFIGGGWAVDTWERPPVVQTVEKLVDRGPPTVHIVGFVHEKEKNDPVAAAIATYRDRTDLTPIATGPDGRFSDDVPAGAYSYEIRADGYKPATCDVDATKPPPVSPAQGRAHVDIDCPMEATPRAGTVLGVVRDADTGQALGGIPIGVADLQHKELRFVTDAGGGFRFEGVAPGVGALSVIAEGYLALVTPVDVKARQETTIDLLLRPQPKHPGVVVTAKEITIRDQIQFALDSAVILPDSFGILTEVADTLIRHGEIKRLEVQGHTDNSGTPEHNRVLSDERATAVRSWLTAHGVPPDRLVARGYGQDQPLVPNVTASDRARNRRVQFIIVERESASPAAIPLTPPAVAPPSPPAVAPPSPPAPKPEPLPGF